jgi:hypothetical protein
MIERVETPRAVKKAITLERNFDKDIWLYNKTSMDDFRATAKDIKIGKIYKKRIMKIKRQRSKSS